MRRALCALAILCAAPIASASPIIIDGSTSDWGPIVADNNLSTWSFSGDIGLIGSIVEDSDDGAGDGGLVGPNQGGQNYDAEAFGLAYQGGVLYGLIVSGQRPDNGLERYGPGDIVIQTSVANYVIEVGGGAGGGAGGSIFELDPGSTYDLAGNGFTNSHGVTGLAGRVHRNPAMLNDPIPPPGPTQLDHSSAGIVVGTADYIFTRDAFTTQHSVIEFSLPIGLLNGEQILGAFWAPSCGNDILEVVPEPATLSLVGLVGLIGLRRRRA